MREILFRGKTSDGSWVYGDLISRTKYRTCMIRWFDDTKNVEDFAAVDQSTVGQFTGLLDKNGVKIFEGDKISDHVGIGVVVWSPEMSALKVLYMAECTGIGKWFADYLDSERATIEVIGNVYDEVSK